MGNSANANKKVSMEVRTGTLLSESRRLKVALGRFSDAVWKLKDSDSLKDIVPNEITVMAIQTEANVLGRKMQLLEAILGHKKKGK